MSPRKISYSEFRQMLEDPSVPDSELRKYVRPVPPHAEAFNPLVEADPDKVEDPLLESAITVGNAWCRWRRRQRFKSRVAAGDRRPVLVSEGDSWFQFPILIDDVIDHLEEKYLVWSCDAAGDTAQNMVFTNAEYMAALGEQAGRVDAFLFSAAGNDVIGEDENGEPVLAGLLHKQTASRTSVEQLINQAALRRVLDRLRDAYGTVVRTIRADGRFAELPILIHGYDFALPYPASSSDRRAPIWAERDEWLGAPMTAKGIADPALRRGIVEFLINALYDMLGEVATGAAGVHLVDARGLLPRVTDWADEIHGTSRGFEKVAAEFDKVLTRVIRPRALRPESAGGMPPPPSEPPPADVHFEPPKKPPLLVGTRTDLAISDAAMGFGNARRFGSGFGRIRLEATIGEDDTVPYWFLLEGARRGRSVCKIETSGTDYSGHFSPGWAGTGFLVAPNILLTNCHVLNSREVASAARAIFDYQDSAPSVPAAQVEFRLDPERLFVASPVSELDYSFVWIHGTPQDRFGFIEFWRGSFIGAPGELANVIHHPGGGRKRASIKENQIIQLGLEDVLLHYAADTEGGSSGAPVFNEQWRLCALHHAATGHLGDELAERIRHAGQSGRILNEGIRTSAIATDLENRAKAGPDPAAARELLGHIGGTDSRTGFFGSLGRPASQRGGLERVVDTYLGTAGDIDVAFWNVEWFNRDYEAKIDDVARIVADLNLDIWALEETSPEATRALVKRMNDVFGQKFEWAASEPDAPGGRQTTTVMWNSLTVRGERREWPDEVDRILKLRSTDPDAARFEAVEGKIFDRYPGLFRFSALNRDGGMSPFDFYLVPVHLKAKEEGAKRRRMASAVLADAIRLVGASGDPETEWMIGGDFNAELSTGQFARLMDAGLFPLSAEDEAGGAITYLGSSHLSLIDSIFLSPDMKVGVGSGDFMIIAADRADPGFIDRVSDHRPVMVRLSLADRPVGGIGGGTGGIGTGTDRDELLRRFVETFSAAPAEALTDLARIVGR